MGAQTIAGALPYCTVFTCTGTIRVQVLWGMFSYKTGIILVGNHPVLYENIHGTCTRVCAWMIRQAGVRKCMYRHTLFFSPA